MMADTKYEDEPMFNKGIDEVSISLQYFCHFTKISFTICIPSIGWNDLVYLAK